MSRFVKVASVPLNIPSVKDKPEGMSISDFMQAAIEHDVAQVLPDKPDLIVLPEMVDTPSDLPLDEKRAFWASRGDRTVRDLAKIAKENHCYIAAGVTRDTPGGKRYNSCVMIDRQGNILGYYDKNYIVPGETPHYGITSGEDITVFECDFGRVGAVICFDLNFEELRLKYRNAKCDMIVFPSHFDGGLLRNIFAHETGAYFVSCYAGRFNDAEVFDPLGYSMVKSTNYHYSIVTTLNLDYKICHLDGNREKFAAAKRKYGSEVTIHDNGYIGTIILRSESPDRTAEDIVKEFDIEIRDDYYARSRVHRERCLAER